MKKTPFILLLTTASLFFFAQGIKAQEQQKAFRIGPKVGVSINDMKMKGFEYGDLYFDFHTNLKLRWKAGVVMEYSFLTAGNINLACQIAPQYDVKGCWYFGNSSVFSVDGLPRTINIHYVDFPIEVCGKFRVLGRQFLTVGFGATFNIGISHVHKSRENVVERFQFGQGEHRNGFHRLDIGAVASIGVESAFGLWFGLDCFVPLRNLSSDNSHSVKFFQAGVTIGYMF